MDMICDSKEEVDVQTGINIAAITFVLVTTVVDCVIIGHALHVIKSKHKDKE